MEAIVSPNISNGKSSTFLKRIQDFPASNRLPDAAYAFKFILHIGIHITAHEIN